MLVLTQRFLLLPSYSRPPSVHSLRTRVFSATKPMKPSWSSTDTTWGCPSTLVSWKKLNYPTTFERRLSSTGSETVAFRDTSVTPKRGRDPILASCSSTASQDPKRDGGKKTPGRAGGKPQRNFWPLVLRYCPGCPIPRRANLV